MIYRRTDVDQWMRIELWQLVDAMATVRQRFGSGAVVQPNELGNIAVFSPFGQNLDGTPSPNGIGIFYAGYIDLAKGDVVWEEDGVNNPLRSPVVVKVDGGRTNVDLDAITDHVANKLHRAFERSALVQ